MRQAPAHVAGPRAFAGAIALVAVSVAFATVGFANLYIGRLNAPETVLTDAERLEHVLERGPWIGVGGAGPVVWTLISNVEQMPAIEGQGYDVRVIFVADANATPEQQQRAVDLARARLGAQSTLEPGEAAGYLAWGRAVESEVNEVLAANAIEPELPLVIWRKGPEWRVIAGQDTAILSRLRADFVPPDA